MLARAQNQGQTVLARAQNQGQKNPGMSHMPGPVILLGYQDSNLD